MNVLDENIIESQAKVLRDRRVPFRQIGIEIGNKGMADREIVALLHGLSRPTFFTRDEDFYRRRLCHARYCLVFLDLPEDEVAEFVVMTLRHANLNVWVKRRGKVICVSASCIRVWEAHSEREAALSW